MCIISGVCTWKGVREFFRACVYSCVYMKVVCVYHYSCQYTHLVQHALGIHVLHFDAHTALKHLRFNIHARVLQLPFVNPRLWYTHPHPPLHVTHTPYNNNTHTRGLRDAYIKSKLRTLWFFYTYVSPISALRFLIIIAS